MKFAHFLPAALAILALAPWASASCSSLARALAEEAYGNDPHKTETREINATTFEVTVGIGNPEDGAHTYRVTFASEACEIRTANVCDMAQVDSSDPQLCRNQ